MKPFVEPRMEITEIEETSFLLTESCEEECEEDCPEEEYCEDSMYR